MLSLFSTGLMAQSITDNLLIHYDLDNNVAIDDSGNGFDGVVSGTQPTSNRFGDLFEAMNFSTGDEFEISNDPILKPQYPLSISFWVSFDLDDFFQSTIFTNDFRRNDYSGFYIGKSMENTIEMGFGAAQGNILPENHRSARSNRVIKTKTWVHVVGVINGPTDMEIYINGCPTEVEYLGTGPDQIGYTDSLAVIGHNDYTTGSRPDAFFDGKLDDFYFWDRAVTEEEARSLYDSFYSPSIELDEIYFVCDPLTLTIPDSLTNVIWSNGDTGSTSEFDETGMYTVAATFDCYEVTDTFEVEAYELNVSLGDDISSCSSTVELTASGEFDFLLWSTGETTSTITVNQSGVYSVSAGNICGDVTDEIAVEMFSIDPPMLESEYSICEGESVLVDVGQAYDEVVWSTGETTSQITISTPGDYAVTVNNDNCVAVKAVFDIEVLESSVREETIPLCGEGDIVINGITYSTIGQFEQVFTNIQGCDSTLVINVVREEGCSDCDVSGKKGLRAKLKVNKTISNQYNVEVTLLEKIFTYADVSQEEANVITQNFLYEYYAYEKGSGIKYMKYKASDMTLTEHRRIHDDQDTRFLDADANELSQTLRTMMPSSSFTVKK